MQNGALFHNTPSESEFDRWLQVSTENAQVLKVWVVAFAILLAVIWAVKLLPINVYRVGTLKNRPLDEAPRPKVNNLESNI